MRTMAALRGEIPSLRLGHLDFGSKGPSQKFSTPPDYSYWLPFADSVSREKTSAALAAGDKLFSSADFARTRFVATKLLNRMDFTGTFRLLEREVILQSVVLQTLDMFLADTPNLLVFPVTPHEFLPYVTQQVAAWLEIPVLFFQPVSICQGVIPRMLLDQKLQNLPPVDPPAPETQRLREQSRSNLKKLLEKHDPTYMVLHKNRDIAAKNKISRILALRYSFRWLFRDRYPTSVDFSGHKGLAGFWGRLLKVLATRSLQNTLSEVNIPNIELGAVKSYAVFALHYEPERTSIPEGLPILFQADAVVAARNLLPVGTELLVKEHYSQSSLAWRGFTGRSPLFYDLIASYPGTAWIDPTSLVDVLENAKCVFTLTGTVAIEAVFLGTPVIYFGNPWWAGLPGTTKVTDGFDINEVFSQTMPSTEEVFQFFDNLTLDTVLPGLGAENLSTVTKRLGQIPRDFLELESKCTVAAIKLALALA